jgi:hypothetical protein
MGSHNGMLVVDASPQPPPLAGHHAPDPIRVARPEYPSGRSQPRPHAALTRANAWAEPTREAAGEHALRPFQNELPAPRPEYDEAYETAAAAYRDLEHGDRRAAAEHFRAALQAGPEHPNARLWHRELAQLTRRWAAEAYSLIREGDGGAGVAAAPLLGGGQSGFRLGYSLSPLAQRPLQLFARASIAQDWLDFDGDSAQAAVGISWRPLGHNGPSIEVERLIGLGENARDAFAARLAGGASGKANMGLPFDLSAYGELGVVGLRSADLYGGGQAYALSPVLSRETLKVSLGGGLWASAQRTGGRTVSRVEIGPSAQVSAPLGDGAIEARLEYRARVAGNAAPGSGATFTLATSF